MTTPLSGSARPVLARALAVGVLALTPPPGSAQETPAVEAPGWIGVRVDERYNCGWEASEAWKNCTLVIQVREMQEDGPAARAGLLIGDRLSAMNGVSITLANLPGLLASIRPGVAVRLDVTREEGDRSLRVVPEVRPPDADELPMVGRRTIVTATGNPGRSTLVFWLSDSTARDPAGRRSAGSDPAGLALVFRNSEDTGVAVEPSAVRVVDGRLNVLPVRDRPASELPAVRRDVLSDLRRETESAYQDFRDALQRVGAVRARLSVMEYRRRVARAAQLALAEASLAVRVQRTFAGAEFEPVRDYSDQVDLDGLLVLRVARGTITARLGLRPGDVVTTAAGRPTRDLDDLVAVLESETEGDPTMVWVRGGREVRGVWPRR